MFLRHRPGFDVILGNPPWQEATLEEHAFWARHFPGLRALPQSELEHKRVRLKRERPDLVRLYESEVQEMALLRKALGSGAYPGMGTGDPDLYKAFCWRFWNLVAKEGGRIGVVLPRGAYSAKGSAEFRRTLLCGASDIDITMILNKKEWIFDNVHEQYLIGLLSVVRGNPVATAIALRGPFSTYTDFHSGRHAHTVRFSAEQVLSWTDTASFPLLPSEGSVDVFAQLRKSPRLDLNDGTDWRARPDRELDATNQKDLMDMESEECPKGFWPIFKGESFDIWAPDTGEYYAFADPDVVIPWLYEKRLRSGRTRRDSVHSEFSPSYRQDKKTLACHHARIAFRDGTNRLNERTVVACLLPPKLFLSNVGPYFLWPRGTPQDHAYLLGVLTSIPLDWYARRIVERHLNFFLANTFPIPRPPSGDKRWMRVVALAGRLASPDKRFAKWAEAVGVERGALPEDEKEDMIAELDAVVAHLYGLTKDQLTHVFETFHDGWDYEPRLKSVLKHFARWAKE